MDFWSRLKDEIKECDLSQESVAFKLKIPVGTFKNWLLRQTFPDAKEAVEIAKLLNTSVEYLVNGKDSTGLTDDERRLVNGFRQLAKSEQAHIAVTIDAWIKKFKGD